MRSAFIFIIDGAIELDMNQNNHQSSSDDLKVMVIYLKWLSCSLCNEISAVRLLGNHSVYVFSRLY